MENFFCDGIRNDLSIFSTDSEKYWEFLDKIGKVCCEKIAANASIVDKKGVKVEENSVVLPHETLENVENIRQTGYIGAILPENYGGMSLPKLIDIVAVEMISRADASLMTLVSLSEMGRLIYSYGTEEQKNRILPGIASGKLSCAMALTEVNAGSNLQALKTVAVEENGEWYLTGDKHFVTNGGADIMLVLARSEESITGGRGLSLFIREKGSDDNCKIMSAAEKHGICGSSTCNIRFEKAKCELLGKRRRGLVEYVLELLLSARLSIAAQALGIADAALCEAEKYAAHRIQFGNKVADFPQIALMLSEMRESVAALRLMVYYTASQYDLVRISLETELQSPEIAERNHKIRSEVEFMVPLVKFFAAEIAEKVTHDSLQIHGGNGYIRGVAVERLARDARVTSIYEGTSQIQILVVVHKTEDGILERLVERLLIDKKDSELADIVLQRVKKLTSIAAAFAENGKISLCEEKIAFSAAFLFAAALVVAKGREDSFHGKFFNHLLFKADFFLSVIEACDAL